MSTLDGKSIVVTGAAQGIGQATAQLATREGGRVLTVDLDEAGLEETGRLVEAEGGQSLRRVCDVTDRSQVDEAVAEAVSENGPVDVLVNLATAFTPGPLEEQTEEDLKLALDVNVLGTFNFMQACFPHMRERGGRIINFGSGSGTGGSAMRASYNAAKEAIRGLSKSAANEWAQYGITVNCVVPMAKTPTFDSTVEGLGEGALERIVATHPMRRVGDPLTDIAPVVTFLASDGAQFITGRTLFVDGGLGGYM